MGHGKKKLKRKGKVWKILDGTYNYKIGKEQVERLIAGIQQEIIPDELDLQTMGAIEEGKIDWSGDVRKHRKPRKHIRKRG